MHLQAHTCKYKTPKRSSFKSHLSFQDTCTTPCISKINIEVLNVKHQRKFYLKKKKPEARRSYILLSPKHLKFPIFFARHHAFVKLIVMKD
jgi:hypothetical protein